MKTGTATLAKFFGAQTNRWRVGFFMAVASLAIIPLFAVSSASNGAKNSIIELASASVTSGHTRITRSAPAIGDNLFGSGRESVVSSLAFLPQSPEAITIYQSDCITPATSFELGDVVCAKITGAPVGSIVQRRVAFVNSTNYVVAQTDVVSSDQTVTFTLPATATTNIGDMETGDVFVDNRGRWRVMGVAPSDGSTRVSSFFDVSDPAQTVANLAIDKFLAGENLVAAGGLITFTLQVTNHGPDAAVDVEFTDAVPTGTTFVSGSQESGPGFTCNNPTAGSTGTSTCTIASLAKDAVAEFRFTYQVNSGLAANTIIENTANVTSDTTERHTPDNTGVASASVSAAVAPTSCALDCPDGITVTANATQGGNSGAFVTYSSAEGVGDCGEITTSTPSGSFFPVGTTSVQVTSETGGGSCSFTVTVVTSGAPTITCPADQTVAAPANSSEASVNPGTPTTNPSTGVTVQSQRSDNELLSAPYPVGTTFITWTVRDSVGLSSSCTQKITVTSDACATDTEPPTITAPANLNLSTPAGTTGSCGRVVGEGELGTPTVTDNCVVNVHRTGVPAGNFFPVGETTITYTATDAAGLSATATQTVTITDNTDPIIFAPADASYTCLNDVPAASASQATGPDVEVNGVLQPGPPSDNCGAPIITINETSSGAGTTASPRIITRVFTATDAALNSASSTQVITVIDSSAPTITAPADVTANTGPDATSCGTDVVLGDPVADDNCAGVIVTRSPAGNNFAVGTHTVTWTATDAVGNTAIATQNVTVNDNTVPTITAPANVTLNTGAGATSCSVTVSDLNATLGIPTAADNCAGVSWARDGGNVFPLGDTIVTYTATDAHGNTATATQTVTVVDNTPPVVTPPANITVSLPLNSSATSMAVSYPNPATATDNCAGTITFSYSPESGSVFPVGPTTVTVTATDAHNNSATATFTVTVLYNFTGFFSPISNLPAFNSVNAGRAIPAKFSLSGDKGLSIFATGSPASQQIACDSNAPLSDLEGTITSGGSTLTYSPDEYHYSWKSESSWAGTCRQLVVTLNDGTTHVANFKFK